MARVGQNGESSLISSVIRRRVQQQRVPETFRPKDSVLDIEEFSTDTSYTRSPVPVEGGPSIVLVMARVRQNGESSSINSVISNGAK